MTAKPVVEYDKWQRRHLVVVRLDPDDADEVGWAMGPFDTASQELHEAADKARRLDAGEDEDD